MTFYAIVLKHVVSQGGTGPTKQAYLLNGSVINPNPNPNPLRSMGQKIGHDPSEIGQLRTCR